MKEEFKTLQQTGTWSLVPKTGQQHIMGCRATRAWYEKLHGALRTLSFTGSQSDHSLFVKKDSMVFVLVYVDDIIVTGPSTSACKHVISQLSSLFPIKDLGALHYFLGIEVHRSSKDIFISQTKYILDLLKKFMHSPRQSHLQAVKRILQYLKGNPICRISIIDIGLWSLLIKITLCTIWSAKKQPTVVRSSTEAEYRSLANTAAEITWICQLLTDISFALPSSPQLWCEAISLAKNPLFHAHTKHVEIDYHYIRESVLSKAISVHFVCTQDQLADICTKSLSKDRDLVDQSLSPPLNDDVELDWTMIV
ncbi:unnamed protein product [Malus baccata var. baccata]